MNAAERGSADRNQQSPQDLDLETEFQDGFARHLIRNLVRKAVIRLQLSAENCEDLEQTVSYELIRRSSRFDPSRGNWEAFTTVVARNCLKTEIDRLLSTNRPAAESVTDIEPTDEQMERLHEQIELQLDVRDLLDRLPPEVRDVCEPLLNSTISDAARQLKQPRSTYRSRLRTIREKWVDSTLEGYL